MVSIEVVSEKELAECHLVWTNVLDREKWIQPLGWLTVCKFTDESDKTQKQAPKDIARPRIEQRHDSRPRMRTSVEHRTEFKTIRDEQ